MVVLWTFLLHVAVTCFMAGLSWFVQVVHYPLFGSVGVDGFSEYEKQHQRRTTWVVAPMMILEGALAVLVVLTRPDRVEPWLVWTGLVLLAVIWLSTLLSQVPQHEKLAKGFDAIAHTTLVSGNWLRTLAWSARAVLSLVMIRQLFD